MNMKTIKNLIILSAFGFVLANASTALAYVPGVWDPMPRIPDNNPAFYKVPVTYDAPVVAQTTTTTYTPPKTTTTTPKNTVATTTHTNNNTAVHSNNTVDSRELKPVVTTNAYDNNELTALSLAGSGGFMPSSIWQWLLVILLILIIIIIARMLSKPHGHEVHTVTVH